MALDKPQVTQMLRAMILIREFDELAIQLRVAGKIYGAVHPYVGQEAVAVGVCSSLTVSDRVTSTHRGHGHCIAKGADIRRMMAELFGRVDGYCKGKGGSMHIADFKVGMLGANGIVGGGLPIACGAALAAQLEGKGDVTVCFFGDGAAAEGEFHEALNIASVWKLPIVFACENNQYAANNAVAVQHPGIDIAAHAGAYQMPGVIVDGNDVLEVHAATGEAVARARRGDGPSLLECKTYRWHFHAMRNTPPPETRSPDEIRYWRARDPIARLEQHGLERGLLSTAEIGAMRERVKSDLEAAVAFAEQSPFPDPKDLLVDMFAE
ncbi:MAG: pyruvate dehydrogenase (acetyl-transferring) E1 component subunit alpha [Candidatus Rokuibacteriota bacterium]|nr:MAG: pyruvate dehydrogenase (acetyl-transferring) E1 component subunit alpha [Candidatus Rokubacteria bacterium]